MSKLKEINRNVTLAWSPAGKKPNLIATATLAGSLDKDFDTSANLELFSVPFSSPKQDLECVGKITLSERVFQLQWGLVGESEAIPYGLLAGGLPDGSLSLWNPAAILEGKTAEEALISNTKQHSAQINTLNFNSLQPNILATAGSDAEIFIWDLSTLSNITAYSVTTTTKSPNAEAIPCVAWNKKVSHILASTSTSGIHTVWDLKYKKAILAFSDPKFKSRCRSLAWNPNEPTQLITASEDDSFPVIQIWDLRNTHSPSAYLEGHGRGIWCLDWCPTDTSLLLSCGKDHRTLCWNVQTGKSIPVEATEQWNCEVHWSPKLSAIFATSSMEGKARVYSLQDIKSVADNNTSGSPFEQFTPATPPDFSRPPKWLKRPAGVAFGFGGKLASFSARKDPKTGHGFTISHVVTEKELLRRSEKLQEALNSQQFVPFCDEKIRRAKDEAEKETWVYIAVLFERNARQQLLNYLGYNPQSTADAIAQFASTLRPQPSAEETPAPKEDKKDDKKEKAEPQKSESDLTAQLTPKVQREESEQAEKPPGTPSPAASPAASPGPTRKTGDVTDLFGDTEDVFGNLVNSLPAQPAPQLKSSPIPSPVASPHIPKSHAPAAAAPTAQPLPELRLSTKDNNAESAITKALLVGNFNVAVDVCLKSGRFADALVLASCGEQSLWKSTQEAYFQTQKSSFIRVIAAIVNRQLRDLVEFANPKDWKESLAILCTYADATEFPVLCDLLASRLAAAGDTQSATLCYICAGNVDKTLQIWTKDLEQAEGKSEDLQDLVEKVSIIRSAIDQHELPDSLVNKFTEYANLLASQGLYSVALNYLSPLKTDWRVAVLIDRIYNTQPFQFAPVVDFPFQRVDVREGAASGPRPGNNTNVLMSSFGLTSSEAAGFPTTSGALKSSQSTFPQTQTTAPTHTGSAVAGGSPFGITASTSIPSAVAGGSPYTMSIGSTQVQNPQHSSVSGFPSSPTSQFPATPQTQQTPPTPTSAPTQPKQFIPTTPSFIPTQPTAPSSFPPSGGPSGSFPSGAYPPSPSGPGAFQVAGAPVDTSKKPIKSQVTPPTFDSVRPTTGTATQSFPSAPGPFVPSAAGPAPTQYTVQPPGPAGTSKPAAAAPAPAAAPSIPPPSPQTQAEITKFIETLTSLMQTTKSHFAAMGDKRAQIVDDNMTKRFPLLFQKLKNNEIPHDIIPLLVRFIEAIQAGDYYYHRCLSMLNNLTSCCYYCLSTRCLSQLMQRRDKHTNVLTQAVVLGLKRVVEVCK